MFSSSCPCRDAALGSRIKYLVDTPEAVWGYLDGDQPLAAARRHLRAECVFACLDYTQHPILKTRFPLLKSQYPAIHNQKADILQRVRDMLLMDVEVPPIKVQRQALPQTVCKF